MVKGLSKWVYITMVVLCLICLILVCYLGGRPDPSVRVTILTEDDVPVPAESLKLLNINTAEAEELVSVLNMNQELANSIIKYREEYGKFVYVEDLLDVPDVEPKVFERWKDYITVGGLE